MVRKRKKIFFFSCLDVQRASPVEVLVTDTTADEIAAKIANSNKGKNISKFKTFNIMYLFLKEFGYLVISVVTVVEFHSVANEIQ